MSYTYLAMDSSAGHVNNVTSPEAVNISEFLLPKFGFKRNSRQDLDVEYTVSMTGIPVIYAANSDATVNAFLTTALAFLDHPHPPSVMSISYGKNNAYEHAPFMLRLPGADEAYVEAPLAT